MGETRGGEVGADTGGVGAGGTASRVAPAGTRTSVSGLVRAALFEPIGRFFMALAGFTVRASPLIWLLMVCDDRWGDAAAVAVEIDIATSRLPSCVRE